MSEKEFIKLVKEIFEDFDIQDLYKIELMKNGKLKIKYSWKSYPNVIGEETFIRK